MPFKSGGEGAPVTSPLASTSWFSPEEFSWLLTSLLLPVSKTEVLVELSEVVGVEGKNGNGNTPVKITTYHCTIMKHNDKKNGIQ